MDQRDGTSPVEQFDTFVGVIRPTLLTMLGALLFLREGWLVGNSGLVGAVVVILGAYVITGTTALSVSSLSTNVRIQAGGAFALIAQALGLEAGGAIGIPLYIAQCASAALYLFAFAEVWLYLFPSHAIGWVVLIAWIAVGTLTTRSARAVLRTQAPLLVMVAVAILTAWLGALDATPRLPEPAEVPQRVSLREAFAIFFPAATGLMVGVGMSGSLREPRKSIPKGILTAWGVSLAVYLVTAVWCATVASPDELLVDKTIMITKSAFGPVVLFGVLCSTFMAAASNFVAAPRLLQAMTAQRVVPFGAQLMAPGGAEATRRCGYVSIAFAGVCLLSGSLDEIAQIVTAFFVLTYLAINLVVFLEQRLAMVSFRPTMEIPGWIPALGLVACSLGLFISSPTTGLVGLALVVVVYVWLHRRRLQTPWETVRSGIHVRVAAWAAQRAGVTDRPERAWAPEILIPVTDVEESDVVIELAHRVAKGIGSIRLVGLRGTADLGLLLQERAVQSQLRGVSTTSTCVDTDEFARGCRVVIDSLRGLFMGPNLVLLGAEGRTERDLQILVDHCHSRRMGMGVFMPHPDGALGRGKVINVWLSERSPDWALTIHNANLDLPVLFAYLLARHPGCAIRLSTVVRAIDDRADAIAFLQRIIDQGRLPEETETHVGEGAFIPAVQASPYADVHLFGLSTTIDRERLEDIRDASGGACVFLLDSGQESVLA